jgi:hypothetical protein
MSEKSKLRCKTPSKAQTNFKKHQRTKMNRVERRTKNILNKNDSKIS